MRDGGGADRTAGERVREGGVQRGRADLIEQMQQARRLADERVPAERERVDEGRGLGAGVAQAIAAAQVVRAPFLGDERGEMRVVFDALLAIVAARVARDLGRAVQEAYDVFGRG
jgi:hypothetical protein